MSTINKNSISGEAPESDSDDEFTKNLSDIHGYVVEGEAPESDEEIISFMNLNPNIPHIQLDSERHHSQTTLNSSSDSESLLIKKLYESNLSLWNNLNNLIQTTALSASKQILKSEQILVKSQITLQSASTTIKKINGTTSQILEKYQDILSSNFIPVIKT